MKILNKTAALSVLCFAAILTLSACSDQRHHQAMLEEINLVKYGNVVSGGASIYTFEIDGVKCIVVSNKAISCDWNDEHIAKNLAAKEKRLAAKASAQSNKQLEQMEDAHLELQRQQGADK